MLDKWGKKFSNVDTGEILSKGLSYLLIRIAGTIITFSFTYYVSSNFGADVYGLIALSFSVFLILSVIGRLGLDMNIVKFFSSAKKSNDKGLFYKSIIRVFLMSCLLSYFLFWKSEFLVGEVFIHPKPELIPYLNWILPSIPFWSVTVLSASLLRSKQMNNWFGFFNNSSRFTFSLILLLFFSYFSKDPIIIVKAHFYAILIISIWSFSMAASKLGNISFRSKKGSWEFTRESFPMMMSASVLVILGWVGTFVMGIYCDSDEVGIYDVAVKVATLLNFCLQAVNSILAPKIANKFAMGDKKAYQGMISFSTKLNFLSSLIIGVFVLIFNQQILGLFGDEFKSAKGILFILCIGQLINSFSGSVGIILQMTGRQVVYQYLMLTALVINLSLLFVLTPVYGAYGAAIASVTSMVFWNILGTVFLKRKLGITAYFVPSIKKDRDQC